MLLSCCKKNNNNSNSANNYTSAKMNGTWLFLGSASATGYATPPDAFVQIKVAVINGSTILAGGDTLQFNSYDKSSGIAAFYHNDNPGSPGINAEWLYYNTYDNSMEYTAQENVSSGGTDLDVFTKGYIPNRSIKTYTADIAGTKALSGTRNDSIYFSTPVDTTTSISAAINFSVINDSTLVFNNDLLGLGDTTLHYKATDSVQQTITYETLHTVYQISTLTYYYSTNKLIFEQRKADLFSNIHLTLQ